MSEVNFYLLKAITTDARERFACRITQKAYQQGLKIYIYCGTPEQATLMDDLLWTFQDISFIPHAQLMTSEVEQVAVGIAHGAMMPKPNYELLVNLAEQIPKFFRQFKRIVEIVPEDIIAKTVARQKYKTYQSIGYEMHSYEID